MRFATVNGEKREAEKELSGLCVGCEQPMIPVCGVKNVKHWRHKVDSDCDRWWENETAWHRLWKNSFPVECQEIRHRADDGEWHIADVKTKQGQILEFQHSFLKTEERTARNHFYGNCLVWVVDGLKRKNDLSRFNLALKEAKLIAPGLNLTQLFSLPVDCPILEDWSECIGPVFFDFGVQFPLWCLLPRSARAARYIGPFSRQSFIELHNGKLTQNGLTFSELMETLKDLVWSVENPHQPTVRSQNAVQFSPRPLLQRGISVFPTQRYGYRPNRGPKRRRRF